MNYTSKLHKYDQVWSKKKLVRYHYILIYFRVHKSMIKTVKSNGMFSFLQKKWRAVRPMSLPVTLPFELVAFQGSRWKTSHDMQFYMTGQY